MFNTLLNFSANLDIQSQVPWLFLILLWTLPWKGFALWKAARNGQKKWFLALFLLNTLAILEILYIFWFSKPKKPSAD